MEVLLVEDNLEDANVTIQALKQGNVRCRVTLVCDGDEAIHFLHREDEFAQAPTPDLVSPWICCFPKEGQHVLAELRFDEKLKHIPVIVLTGSLVHRAILQAQKLHVDGFMTKPVDLEQFVSAVKSLHRSWLTELLLTSVG